MKLKLIVLIFISIFLFSSCTNSPLPKAKSTLSTNTGLILGSVEYVKKIQEFSLASGNRNALTIIMKDVDKNGSALDNNNPDNIHRLYKLVSSLVFKIGYVDIQTHYFRNKLNRAPGKLKEIIHLNSTLPINKRWRLLGITNSEYHIQGTDGEYNLKFLSYDGFCEAVYDKKGVLLNEKNDPINMGTFNFAAGITSINAHGKFDVAPYLKWGNAPNSPQKGNSEINKGVHLALINYKKHAASVFLYRKNLFGLQQGKVL